MIKEKTKSIAHNKNWRMIFLIDDDLRSKKLQYIADKCNVKIMHVVGDTYLLKDPGKENLFNRFLTLIEEQNVVTDIDQMTIPEDEDGTVNYILSYKGE